MAERDRELQGEGRVDAECGTPVRWAFRGVMSIRRYGPLPRRKPRAANWSPPMDDRNGTRPADGGSGDPGSGVGDDDGARIDDTSEHDLVRIRNGLRALS